MGDHAATISRESRGLFTAAAAWMFLLAISVGFVLVQPLAAAPLAHSARHGFFALLAGDAGAREMFNLGLYASLLFLPPLVVLAGCAWVETWIAKERPPRASDRLIWPVQLAFGAATLIALSVLALAYFPPTPLIHLELTSGSLLEWTKLVLIYIVALIASEFVFYWLHRAEHRYAWLWRFHAVHHSQHHLDILHAVTHPVEGVMRLMVVAGSIGLLVGFDLTPLCLLVALMTLQSRLTHMRAPINFGPLGRILADNRYHFIHHSRDPADYNCNFSDRFPFIDMLFGTYRPPREVLPETGLPDRAAPMSLTQYMLAVCPEHRDAAARDA
jgi:sterol desaturase/sphingolipid hydroxylase (fatty acid hydroxylase superfamily)